jgi:protein gp37
MAATTNIEWADSTANFWIGCTKDGAGCVNCYAESEWDKRRHRVEWGPRGARSECKAGPILLRKLHHAAATNLGVDPDLGRRRRVFINSLSDSLDPHPSIVWRDAMFAQMQDCWTLDLLLLTKRIENLAEMAPASWRFAAWPRHIWTGISVPTQKEADEDLPLLVELKHRFGIRRIFLSLEPLIERVDIPDELMQHVDWAIVGGESGRNPRPMHPDWERTLRHQCGRLGVPYLGKQWGEWSPNRGSLPAFGIGSPEIRCAWPDGTVEGGTMHQHGGAGIPLWRVGKRAAGRLFDGIEHNGFPA